MNDKDKTKEQLIAELEEMRQRVAESETVETEYKQSIEALLESEERFRSIVEFAQDAILLVDNHLNIIYWNEGAKSIFGYEKGEILGKSLQILVPERHKDGNKRAMEKVIETGISSNKVQVFKIERVKKDGSEFPAEIATSIWKKR